ncbi:MAG: molecular chaperone TorD family protein [Eggerthellaceae bacterium]|nr:molecular chaperone TorD family protein [Eggerthellaceae bacterium]
MRTENIEKIKELASARRYAYIAFQRLVGNEPSCELIETLDCDVLRMAFAIAGALPNASDEVEALVRELSAACARIESVKSDYARIFVGPAALPAPPWESVYRGKKRLLMTTSTLSVREYYRACGYEAQCLRHVPDDHLALELDFLSALAQEALDACDVGDEQSARNALQSGQTFLKAHLALWVGEFASDLREHDGSSFYCAIADALAAFVEADCEA